MNFLNHVCAKGFVFITNMSDQSWAFETTGRVLHKDVLQVIAKVLGRA